MSKEWLQLTEEDIARAQQLTRSQPPMPGVITITSDDLPPSTHPQPVLGDNILSITMDDLVPVGPQSENTADLQAFEQLMYEMVNEARQSHLPRWVGTSHLTWHDGLAAVARGHSADMLQRQYVSHVTPEGVSASRRIELGHISYVACGENIGIVYGRSAHSQQGIHDIHNAFMNQPRSLTNHRGNLLNPVWTHVGIGVAYHSDGSLVATQNFISAPTARLRGK